MKKIIGISFIFLSVVLFSCNNDKINVAEDSTLAEKSAEITLSEATLEAATTASEYEVEFYANAEGLLSRWWKMGKRWEWTNKMHYMSRQCPNVTVAEGKNRRWDAALVYKFRPGKVKTDLGISVLNVFNTENVKYTNFRSTTVDDISLVNIYTDAVPFTPTLFFNIEF